MIEIPVFKFAIDENLSDIFLPTKGSEKATGWDIRAAAAVRLRAGQYAKIPLGFQVLAPEGWWLDLRPRSSSFTKKQLHALYGVIDEDYEGQCLFACQYIPDISSIGTDLKIEAGEAIGQIIPVKRKEMVVTRINKEEYRLEVQVRNYNRGAGGFGSTDKK